MSPPSPAYRITTDRLVLRCWSPADAPRLKAAIDASIEHLRPFIPWAAREPTSVEEKVAMLRLMRARFDLDQDYVYGVFDADEREVLGGTGLHARVGEGGLEIGYWIRAERTGQGLATEVAGALTRVGFEVHDLHRVEIHCATANAHSAAIPKKLGYTLECTLRERTPIAGGALADKQCWTLFAADYPKSRAALTRVRAFDVAGRPLL